MQLQLDSRKCLNILITSCFAFNGTADAFLPAWRCFLDCASQVFVAGVSGLKVDMVRSMAMSQLTSGQHHVKLSKQQ